MRSIVTSMLLFLPLLACHPSKPPLAAPASLEAVASSLPAPPLEPIPPRATGPLWTLCDDTHPERGVCLSIPQVREIRLRYAKTLAARDRLVIDERERADKGEVRIEAAEAARRRAIAVGIGISAGVLLLGLVTGGLIGHFAF